MRTFDQPPNTPGIEEEFSVAQVQWVAGHLALLHLWRFFSLSLIEQADLIW